MRRGELLGLIGVTSTWSVACSASSGASRRPKLGLRLKSPKTKRGRRNIGLPVEAIAMLRAHKVKQLELRLLLGLGNIAADTLVFCTVGGRAAVA